MHAFEERRELEGEIGSKTRRAVRAVEQQIGISPTGHTAARFCRRCEDARRSGTA